MSKPQVEFIEVDGINLRVATQGGRDGGLPLLLFNGIGANLELCFPFMEAMPEKEIVIFDVPGVGRSEMSWRPRRLLRASPAWPTNYSTGSAISRWT
jgi:hypothetical protein